LPGSGSKRDRAPSRAWRLRFAAPIIVDAETIAELRELIRWARSISRNLPGSVGTPFACTAGRVFRYGHRTRFVDDALRFLSSTSVRLRRFSFGLSYEYKPAARTIVSSRRRRRHVAHLGNGASLRDEGRRSIAAAWASRRWKACPLGAAADESTLDCCFICSERRDDPRSCHSSYERSGPLASPKSR
jgi:acetate kinase